jgi:hypothetical protein
MSTHTLTDIEKLKVDRNIEELGAALSNQEIPEIRQKAAEALGQIGGAQAVRSLVVRLPETDENVRSAIIQALTACKDSSKIVLELMKDPDEKTQRGAIEAAIYIIGNKNKTTSQPKGLQGSQSFLIRLGIFLLGAVLWGIPWLMIALVSLSTSDFGWSFALFLVGFVAMIIIAMKGWDRTFVDRAYNPVPIYKGIAVFAIMATIIGLIWVFYWTGKGALRLYYRE